MIPSDEPFGALVPEIADLIAEPQAPGQLTLVGTLGDELELAASAQDQGVVDGNVFRLVSIADVPPPPEVVDVTDAVAEILDTATGRWDSTHRAVAGGITLGVLSLTATWSLLDGAAWLGATVMAVFTVLATVIGRTSSRRGGMVAVAAALGAVPATTVAVAALLPPVLQTPLAVVLIGLGLTWIAIGVGMGVGDVLPALVGGLVGVTLSSIGIGCLLIGVSPAGTAAILTVILTATLGSLPMLALNASQVTTLDDLVISGIPSLRSTVASRVAAAYAMFGWAVYAVAGIGAVVLVSLLGTGGVWPNILAAGLLLVLLLRTRVMPLAYQAWPLWCGGVGGVLVGVLVGGYVPKGGIIAGCVGAAVVAVVLVAARPRPHTRVRIRRLGDLMEGLAVLAMVPAVLGTFGVFDLMLEVF